MFNRRKFLKVGAATFPLAAAIEALHPTLRARLKLLPI